MRRPITSFLIILFSALLLNLQVVSSERAIRVDLFGVESGLSQSAINCLLVDSYGFLWAGTQDGLNRYDGYSFKIFRNNPLDTTSLSNNNINAVCEDSKGNLWVATWNGLSVFKRNEDQFRNYFHDPENLNSISANRIFYVYEDSYGVIWIKTLESLDRYDSGTDSFVRYPHFSDPFSFITDNNDFTIFEDSQKRLWVGSKDGLMFFDRHLGLFKRYTFDPRNQKSISNNRIKDVYEDSSKTLWIATAGGLNRYNSKSDDFTRYINYPNNPKSLHDNLVNTIFQDSHGLIWLGTDKGLSNFDFSKEEFSAYSKIVDGSSLYTTAVTSIVEDNSNILWLGTLSGLVKWDRKASKFKLYNKLQNGDNVFSGNIIASLFEGNDGILWVGTWGTGLHFLDRKTGAVRKYSENFSSPRKIANDYVHVIFQKKDGEILIGTRNGIQVYNPSTRGFEDYFTKYGVEANQLFSENRVYSMLEGKNKNLWIGTRLGLFKFNGKSIEGFYNNSNDSLSLSSSEIHCLEIDGNNLWVATLNGLNCFNIETNTVKRYKRKKNYSKGGLISNDILSLKIDSKGFLWVGTASGLHKFDSKNEVFTLYTETDGLPNNLIYAIEEDFQGNIWVSTNWGLAMVNPDSHKITSYGVSDGLQSHEFNIGASYKSDTGELFFGGITGLNAFYPDSIKLNAITPPVAITSFEVLGPLGKKEVPVTGKSEVVINQNFSLLNIEFSALDFTYPQKNTYMYKMEGLDDEWINIGTKHSATFSNLREGVYTFKVRGANSDNIWNDEGVSLRIIVTTEFWKSRSAFWGYGLLFFLSLFLFLRTRTKILRKTSKLLKERESTMAEMEDQKEELLLKNKNITDSINYAKRIQEALLPSDQNFKKVLPDSFILYMPKDIVSGDFYWVNETHNKIFVAVIDCTGHGVPGAFMSIIGVELLRNITNVMGINDAAEILNRLDQGVRDTFSKNINDDAVNVKDGMDVSFCVIDKELNTLQFAGAFSNLYIIRDNKIIEIKGDRFTVGIGYEPEKSLFVNHDIVIQPDDMVYLFTDGYVDQFGGPEGKKYKFRRFRHLLLNIHKYPLEIQRKYLFGSINEWKGNLEQVDDILIIGIKPDLSCMF